ncbi:hypothetical protein V8B55DRAFT_1288803, partial [Mucor lusitanicus]
LQVPSNQSFPYCSSFNLEQKEPLLIRHVYDIDSLSYATDFDQSELLSLKLRDIFDKYSAPREMSRESVYLVNTIIKNVADTEGSANKDNHVTTTMRCIVYPKLLQFDTLEARMRKKKTGVQAFVYKVCPRGCKVYPKKDASDDDGVCDHCGRPKSQAQNMKVLSIGDQLARILSNKTKRNEILSYR